MPDFANQPYNILPPLPPEKNIETPEVLKASIAANRLLAELKGKAESLPNPEILINNVVLQEAKASSEIENIITTNDKLFIALSAKDQQTDPQTKEVLRYRQALWQGIEALKNGEFDTPLFTRIMQIIKKTEEGITASTGVVLERLYHLP